MQAVIDVDEDDYLVSMRLQNKLHQCGSRDATSNWSTLFYRSSYGEALLIGLSAGPTNS